MFFSVIIPVFNRPGEAKELLESLALQSEKDFEVILVEDGSEITCEKVVEEFKEKFPVQYLFQENQGQGFARNNGMKVANGDFFVILDSDVILPQDYLYQLKKAIYLRKLDAFGGPDAADQSFTPLQKAMDFAMTSFLTTGGIRGKLKDPAKFQARGFNMGVSREVFNQTQGFFDPNRAEDIEWSMRIKKAGFRIELVQEAFVYHKRKNTLKSFAKQAFSFGRNRVNVSRFHPEAIQPVHLMPLFFLLFCLSMFFTQAASKSLFGMQLLMIGSWSILILVSASQKFKSAKTGILSLITSFVQLLSYGLGLIWELFIKLSKG